MNMLQIRQLNAKKGKMQRCRNELGYIWWREEVGGLKRVKSKYLVSCPITGVKQIAENDKIHLRLTFSSL